MFSLLRILIRFVTWIVSRGAVGLIILTALVAAWPQSLHLYLEQLCPSGGQIYALRDWRPELAEQPEGFLPVCAGKGQIIDEAGERMLEIGVGAFFVAMVSGVVYLGAAPRKGSASTPPQSNVQRSEATTRAGQQTPQAAAASLPKPMQRMAQALRRQAELAQAKGTTSGPAPPPAPTAADMQAARTARHESTVQRSGGNRGVSSLSQGRPHRGVVDRG